MHPAEGENAALGLTHGSGNVRHGNGEADELVLVVHHKRYQILVQYGRILLHIAVYLLLGQLGVFIQAGEGLIEHMEHFPAPAGHLPDGGGPIDTDAKALRNAVRELEHGRHLCWDVHHALGPVHILGEAQALQVFRIIGIVVDDRKRALVLKTFHQQAFAVHVREAQRALDFLCAPLRAPGNYRLDERLAHIEVLNEVYPAKADGILLPLLIGFFIDDGSHAAHGFAALLGQEQFPFAERQGRIVRSQCLVFVILKGRNPLVAVFVQVQREFDKFLEHALARNGHDGGFRFHRS